MPRGDEQGKKFGTRITGVAKAAAGIVGVLAGLATYFHLPAGEQTCQSLALQGYSIPLLCPESVKPVDPADAAIFLDRFIGRAGASTPRNAWLMLSDEVHDVLPLDQFEQAWKPVDWAERIGDIVPSGVFNTFTVRYRTYSGSAGGYAATRGRVTERHVDITLRRTDPDSEIEPGTGLPLEISQLGTADRDSEVVVPFVSVRLTETVTPLERPNLGSQKTAPQPASQLAVYCAVDQYEPIPTTWVRTGLGWLPVDGSSVQVEAAPPPCDPHHVGASD